VSVRVVRVTYAVTLGVALILLALASFGCAPTNLAEVLKSAGGDPASVCGSITTVYGTAKFARSGCTNCNVACTQDGLTIRSTGAIDPLGNVRKP